MSYAEDYVARLRQIQQDQILGQITQPVASKSEFANMILQKARSDWSLSEPPSTPTKKNFGQKAKSVALGVMDILARPSYTVNEAANQVFNEGDSLGDVLKGAKEGFTGKKQTSFIDVLQTQHKNEVKDSDEYKQILQDYGQKEADWFEQSKKSEIETGNVGDIVGGLLVDFTFDPLNAVGAGLLTKPYKALKGTLKATEEVEDVTQAGREIGQEAIAEGQPQAVPEVESAPVETVGPDLLSKLREANLNPQSQLEFPRTEGKFASNRRPPVKTIEGQQVKADYSPGLLESLQQQPRFANLTDVFKRDLREKDFEGLQKARIQNETAQIVDQVGKGNPAAVDALTHKDINPLSPVARASVDNSVRQIVREISESIPDLAKAKAVGKQPRWPLNNAPTQNNLSSRLTNLARQQLIKESYNSRTGSAIKKAAAPALVPAVYDRYIDMLKNAEESLVTKARVEKNDSYFPRGGIKPSSPYLRLSDVLEALPRELAQKAILGPNPKDKVLPSVLLKAITGNNAALGKLSRNKELFEAVQQIDWTPMMVKEYATRTIDAANAAQETTESVAKFLSTKFGDETASDVNKAGVTDEIVKAAKNEFRNEMPEAKSSLGEMLDGLRKSMPNPLPSPVDDIIERGKHKLAAGVFSAGNGQKVAQNPRIQTAAAVTEEALDGVPVKQAGLNLELAEAAADKGIFSTVLKWVDPASGYKDLRPLVLKNISVRKTSATTRAHEIIKLFNSIPENQHLDFWNEVKGAIPVTPDHREPVAMICKMLQNLFGDSGLAEKFAGNTALSRAGINVDHLNKHMRIVGIKDFKFTRDVPDPIDLSKTIHLNPEQVLDTWKNYIPKDSADLRVFLFNMSQAVENSMVEYSTFANMGALWGSRTPKSGYIQVDGMHSAIDGMHFPKDIVSQIGAMARGIDDMYESTSNSQLLKMYDQALRTWKTGVTIYAPSHHIRNMIGDMFTSWLDGVSNPMYYTKAAQVLKANARRYSDMKPGTSPLSDILGDSRETELIKEITGQGDKRVPKGTRVIANARIGKKNFPLSIDQVYQMGFRHGLFPHSSVIEDLPGSETLMESLAQRFHPGKVGPFQPFKGSVARGVKSFSESREHYVRIAHYLHALENTKAGSLDELFQKAADRVRKYHPDGLDLTQTEKKVFRRLIPFYSWNRKAIPLVLEGLVMNPAKILAYPKLMSGMQELQGQESSISEPWPDDQLFPDWLSSNVIGPMLPPDSGFARAIARSPAEVGYTLINPGLPSTDLLEDYGNNPVKGIGNSITPFIKLPAEMAFGTEFQSGAPISDKTEYIDKNIPLLSTVSRLTNGAVGTGLAEGGDLKGKETSTTNLPALINFLTAAGILDTGRYIKGGEFDLRERIAKEKKNGAQ